MSVLEPRGHGLIVRKGPRTRIALQALREKYTRDIDYRDDGHLVAVTLRGGTEKRDEWLVRLENAGLVRGEDFVVTLSGSQYSSNDGVQGRVPSWLLVSVTPTGNPPELEAKMEPDVREMWQLRRVREYSIFIG